jgi:SSS family solute:Na+ symporter
MVTTNDFLILAITGAYFLLVLGVGQLAARTTQASREDFLVADRSFNTVVLLFALFATNMTAVVMIGAPGLAYGTGAGSYGFFVSLFAFLFPVFIMTIGYRIWLAGKEFGHITPGQVLNHRWDAKYLGLLTTVLFTVWTVPYILVGVQGGGITIETLTGGLIPYWAGALVVLIVVAAYVYQGGMRGTGWTNTFQGAVFMLFLLAMFLLIPLRLGGFDAATGAVASIGDGAFLNRAGIPPFGSRTWFSQALIVALGAFVYPHLVIRYMTAKSITTLKNTALLYPIAVILVWVPAIMIGFWGIAQLPDLANPDFVLPTMVAQSLPPWAIGFALAAILAALMSSIDGQVLTLSTLFSEDVIREFVDLEEQREVRYTRIFLVVILIAAYVGALLTRETVIDTATFAFSGYALMFFPIVSAFYWKRSTKEGAYAGLLWGFVFIWAFELGLVPMNLTFGFLPFIPVLASQLIVMTAVNLATSASEAPASVYERLFENVW